jgi:cell division protein FtsB
MIQFIQKNAKYISMAGALTLLVISYQQQRELSRLRKENIELKKEISNSDTTKILK